MNEMFELNPFNADTNNSDILDTDMDDITESTDVSIPVPGGLKETPDSKPYDDASISIPSGTTIDAATYNKALDTLQKSFKEAADLMESLKGVQVVDATLEQKQSDFNDDAYVWAMENGPVFESVQKEDKNDIKAIIEKIRPKVLKTCKSDNVRFYKIGIIYRFLRRLDATERLWQWIGAIFIEPRNLETFVNGLNEELAEDLGKYKIYAIKAEVGKPCKYVGDGTGYALLVERKLTAELKKSIEKFNQIVDESDDDSKSSDKKDD